MTETMRRLGRVYAFKVRDAQSDRKVPANLRMVRFVFVAACSTWCRHCS